MRDAKALFLAVVGGLALPALRAQEADDEAGAPDLAFLEYLGSWQEDDAEWLIVAEWDGTDAPPADARPETEEDDDDE